ncbi:MAG: PAS domain-containing protein [Gemmatimonadaceae bacterium]|nr:PAS domain-containing protein [Gemmatimonadaceae bacterium]
MSSSKPDAIAVDGDSALTGEKLNEFLSVISEARDFHSAATLLVAQFADTAGARRAFALNLASPPETLAVSAAVGFDDAEYPTAQISIHDYDNPVVVSALSLLPLACKDGGTIAGVPFDEWIAIPFPQPQFRNAPKLLPEAKLNRFGLPGCVVHIDSVTERRRRVGLAPAGVIILEASLTPDQLNDLYHAAGLAGPVLSRMAAVEEFRVSTDRLDQQRDLLTAIVNSLPDPIVIINSAGNIVVQNRRAEHLLAFTDADSEGRRRAVEINNLLFTSHLSKAAIGGGVAETSGSRELNMVDPDEGTDLLFEVLTHELTAAEGAHAGSTVSVLRDVTDLRRAAGELERQVQRVRLAEIDAKRERDRLNLILENVADPILVTDDRSNIVLMNKQAEQLFETSDDGDRWIRTDAVRANDTKFTTFISDFTISPARARREQMSLLIPESNIELPVEVVSGKIMNRRGEALAIVSVLHDLTEQVENERLYEELKKFSSELEERIREATTDLAEQNTRLQWQSRELEKANRLKSEFLASMSHELRTPINALIGYTALMLDRIYGELTPRQEDGLTRIQASAQHLLALINDILDLAKIEAGRMPLHLETVSLREVITEITQQIEPLVKKKSALTFSVEMPDQDLEMHTDRTKVKQILLNLLSNAVKFTHTGGIWLTATDLGDRIRLQVRDTGIGIKESDMDAIWEDFRQVDQSRTREFGGTGLGLSITRKLVDALGGKVETESAYGTGSTFSVILPLHSQPRMDSVIRQALPQATDVDS